MNRKQILIGLGAAALLAGTAGTFAIAAGPAAFGGGMMGFGGHGGPGGGGHGMMLMQVIKQFDGNKDMSITKDEVAAFEKDALAKYDADKDGKLSLAEFEKAFDAFIHPMAVRAFQHFDPDGDAAVTAAEFSEPFDHMMTMMDRNKDGVIDQKDRPQGGGWKRHGMGHRGGHGWFGQGDSPDGGGMMDGGMGGGMMAPDAPNTDAPNPDAQGDQPKLSLPPAN